MSARTAGAPRFAGFPDEALVFYEGLEADNSKPYWTDHKQVYEECVRAPMEALLAELAAEFGPANFFRPYRDVRFSKDKTPYKTVAGAVAHEPASRSARYVQLSADGLFLAGGYWQTASDQVDRLRRAVADDVAGPALERVVARLEKDGFTVDGHRLTRVPRGYPPDHPRADLLRLRTLTASVRYPPEPWLHTREVLERVRARWRQLAPLADWLGTHVGPSAAPERSR